MGSLFDLGNVSSCDFRLRQVKVHIQHSIKFNQAFQQGKGEGKAGA
jgi:hypothetical protein